MVHEDIGARFPDATDSGRALSGRARQGLHLAESLSSLISYCLCTVSPISYKNRIILVRFGEDIVPVADDLVANL